MALGNEATAFGTQSVAIGYQSQVKIADHKKQSADNAIALGTGAKVNVAEKAKSADNAIALGKNATIEAVSDNATVNNAIAIGTNSYVNGENSIALGAFSQAGTNAVALGSGSVAEDDTVSVGNSAKGLTRKITNVKDGENLTDAVNVKQLNTKTANMVEWDPILDDEGNPTGAYTENTIHGVILDSGTINAANGGAIGGIHVDAAGKMWDLKNDGNYGLMYSEGNLELSGALTAANGAVKIYDNGIVQAGDKILLNSSMGQVIADSVGANDVTTQSFTAGNGKVKVDKDGKLSTTGEVLMQNGKGESLAMTDGGLSLMSTDNGTGMVTVANGEVNLMGGGNTTVTVDGNGTTFGTLTGDAKTTISGGSITGLTNQKWNGKTDDESRAATEGQLADLSEDLNTSIDTATKGVVKWDDADQDSIHGVGLEEGGHLTATTISANNGHFTVDEDGLTMTRSNGQDVFTVDENGAVTAAGGLFKISDGGAVSGKTMNGTFFNMDDNGIMMGLTADDGQTPGTTVQVTNNGVLFTDGKSEMGTTINGNTIHTGSITATGTSTLGDVKIGEGLVDGVDVSELDTTVGELDKNAVKWDDADQDSIHGVGLEEGGHLTATTISANNGHFKVNEDGLTMTKVGGDEVFSVDEYGGVTAAGGLFSVNDAGEINSQTVNGVYQFQMNEEQGITLGSVGGAGIQINDNNIALTNGTTATNINGNHIETGSIVATGTSTLGGVKIGEGLVDGVDVSKLATSVGTLDQNAVKYDEDGSLHAGKEGTGQLDLNADGSASITSSEGNGFTANTDGTNTITGDTNIDGTLAVENGANINGGASISGGASITGGLTVDGIDIGGSVADVSANVEEIKGDVAQNATDISGIKGQIGVAENQTVSDALTNKGETLVAGINQNTAAIGDVTALKGTNANGEKYTNLTDAVNGNYDRIEQNTTAIAQNSQAINSLGHRVSDLGDEIDSVGAISAALAGLHPLDYDGTGSKFQISAAMGTYDGTQAAAIGGFYHFNRDVMMSLGGATSFEGDKKTAANIGVTFRVGEGASGKTVSNDILARLEAMDQKIAALEQENKELKNVLGAIDTSLSKEFPDVPANHWAYEAVTKLAGNDVVAGYPDGEFHGDRTMTRYEMAEIIYKAMNRGAKVDQKLVEEFKPEMEQVAANETAQAQSTPAQEAPAQDAQ